ncbi:PAS domain S-box protein [Pedobacter hiemivivus]|uniref:histidine kinase n=1 Tax=Pedobacter hiemivivus TaxID=2530454 RepID=A0A4U1G249_9SPHI|nr:PAS domain S-box protein [Pedobacter hiemivivus]TKC57641.1 PAS domain S-box protein [Pedobacter hiemivivus]
MSEHQNKKLNDLSSEQQLLNYQKRIANILESFTDAFFEVDSEWTVTYWNKEAEKLLLMPRHKIIGQNLWEVYHDAIPLKFYTEYHRAMDNNIAVHFEEFFPPHQIWIEVAAYPSGTGLSIYFKDITERRNSVIKLEKEKQKYIELFNLSPVPQWVYDLNSLQFLNINEAAIQHYGYNRAEFMEMTILDVRPEEDMDCLFDILTKEDSIGLFDKSIVRHIKKNGDMIYVCVEGNNVLFEGKSARLVMIIDRTAEMRAKQAMEESIERFNIVSKATSDAIWDWNILTGEMIWNRGIAGIFGHKKTSSTEEWWRSHVHPEDLEDVIKKVDFLIKNKKQRIKIDYRFRCADGSYKFVQDRAFILFDQLGQPIRMIGSMQDITARVSRIRAIEEQNSRLREISWIQSHKIRSPLSKILGLVSLINLHDIDLMSVKELIPHLKASSEELDMVLKDIIKKTHHHLS